MINTKTKVESSKVKKTKQIIKDAFIELYRNKPINNISIKEITDIAGFNRGTFYIHFKDIYDLLEQIENEILFDIEEISNQIFSTDTESIEEKFRSPNLGFLEMLKYIKQRKKYLEVLFGKNETPTFIRKLKKHTQQIIYNHLKSLNLISNNLNEFSLEYISSANIGLIIYWVQTDMKISEEELVQIMGDFIFKGPLSICSRD